MNVAIRKPRMTREQFFEWVQEQDLRHEFDGFEPSRCWGTRSITMPSGWPFIARLYERLKGSACRPFGPDAGVATTGNAVRYPDALIACTRARSDDPWTASALVAGDLLRIPEVQIELPVDAFYDAVDLQATDGP